MTSGVVVLSSLSKCTLAGLLSGTGTPDTGEWSFFNYFVFNIPEVSWGQMAAAWLNPHCSDAPLCFIQGTCTASFAFDLIFFVPPQTNRQSHTDAHNLHTVHTPAKVNSSFKFHQLIFISLLSFEGRGLQKK